MSLTGGTRTLVLEAPNDERANWRSAMFSQKKNPALPGFHFVILTEAQTLVK